MKMQSQAISVLLQASKDSYPALGRQFTYEAARKSAEAGQFPQARDLLASLLKDSPYNGEYLAAMADIYAQSGDDQDLAQFYRDQIAAFRTAPLAADVRKSEIATLRRGLIPALTRMKNYSGGIDQYIELINNFPEDDTLVTEAALYALRYQRQQQLVGFYAKTVAQSPRDYRWSMVLARMHTNLEDYPAAIDTYAKSIAIRPDRVDLYIARAGLEERLMRFDEAAADYEHIYQLAYRDPQWMEKLAGIRARQGRVPEAVSALKVALIDGRPEDARNYFDVARRLENWGMLDQARGFAEQGISKAGPDLLADAQYQEGAKAYVRILTRLRQHDAAYATLQKALEDSTANLPILKDQVQRQGIIGMTDAQWWREHSHSIRLQTARSGMESALQEMGNTVNTYFTPEERLTFTQFAESKHNSMNLDDVGSFAIPLAMSAALADQEAHWRFDMILHNAGQPNHYLAIQPLVDLQRRRGRFAELGSQMEQIAAVMPQDRRSSPLTAAADAYHSAGDEQNELHVLSTVFSWNNLDTSRRERFLQLLLEKQPQELVRIAASWNNPSSEAAASYAITKGSAALAHAVVQARSKQRSPVWNKAYNALVGLYFEEPTPDVNNAFVAALGDDSIGIRLAKPVNRDHQLAGNTWFYYGSRYGEYLGSLRLGNPEDFLPAILEESPATGSGYLTLADYYYGAGDTKHAIADYDHTLELSPDRPDIYDKLALAYFKQGDRVAAIAQWKLALSVLSKQLNSSRVPEGFWRDFGRTCDQLRTHHLFAELKPDTDAIVRNYLRHNGTWLSNAVLHPVYLAQGDPAAATAWLLDVASAAPDPAHVLGDVVDASWIPKPQRAVIYERILQLKETAMAKLDGLERQSAQQDLGFWQERWINYLVESKQYSAAANGLAGLPRETRDSQKNRLIPLEFHAAAQLGTLDSTLNGYRTEPATAPSAQILRDAAKQLFEAGDKQSARKILEFVFARDIEDHNLVGANFLGLAEIRLAAGDIPAALDLLRRLVVVVGNPYEYLDPAAALLEKSHHDAEAVEFLEQLVKSAPWDPSDRLRLAKSRLASASDSTNAQSSLQTIASSPGNSYELRLKAAAVLEGHPHAPLGSGELDLLAAAPQTVTSAAADKFYYYEGRIKAAARASDLQPKMQLLSHCVTDFPRRDTARVPLFQASIESHSDEYALGILEPLFQTQFLRNTAVQVQNEDAQIASSGEADEEEGGDQFNTLRATNAQISTAQQAQVAQQIGDTMKRVGRFADALSYYQTARSRETSPPAKKVLLRKMDEMRATLRIEQQNAARQPILHEALEQDRVVRPRLLARAAPAVARTPASQGGAQR